MEASLETLPATACLGCFIEGFAETGMRLGAEQRSFSCCNLDRPGEYSPRCPPPPHDLMKSTSRSGCHPALPPFAVVVGATSTSIQAALTLATESARVICPFVYPTQAKPGGLSLAYGALPPASASVPEERRISGANCLIRGNMGSSSQGGESRPRLGGSMQKLRQAPIVRSASAFFGEGRCLPSKQLVRVSILIKAPHQGCVKLSSASLLVLCQVSRRQCRCHAARQPPAMLKQVHSAAGAGAAGVSCSGQLRRHEPAAYCHPHVAETRI